MRGAERAYDDMLVGGRSEDAWLYVGAGVESYLVAEPVSMWMSETCGGSSFHAVMITMPT